ncbi:uncharacterized protein OCT59_021439 [Rhizophagus irregularis]|uniref:uncharacterized protein n=1 Tax=Rhizophagus irregularis TaxID=588596 RepID=UPI000CBD3233|nr:hypothetical protein OCT59_021439 [Rhizophagus irregularis]
MINLHAVTSLAEDLSLDLVDIYGIHKWIQMQASPLNDPDIVVEMVRNLPVKEFGKHLKINRLWYNCCKAELWKRHKEAEEAYNRVVDHYRKAVDNFIEADQKKYTRFAGMVVVEKSLLRCDFITQESDWKKWTQMTYNIQLLKEGHTFDDSDDKSDDEEVSLDDSDDEEYF